MPLIRLVRATVRLPHRRHFAMESPGGRLFGVALVALGVGLLAVAAAPMLAGAQTASGICSPQPCDPGVRPGPAGAGGPINGLTYNQQAFFTEGES